MEATLGAIYTQKNSNRQIGRITGEAAKSPKYREKKWWRWTESNCRRRGYEPRALTN